MKLALLQTPVGYDMQQNLDTACIYIAEAAKNGADMAILPEMFNCPYSAEYFKRFAQPEGDKGWQDMASCAKKNHICVVAGSMPEADGTAIFNTCYVFNREGKQLAKHRKVHLFDINIENGQYFCESDTFSAGQQVTVFDFEGHRFGLCICFDFRFPELSRLMSLEGAEMILVPAAFNMTTGPLHWETMFRQRATDDQLFTVGVAPARDEQGVYVSYANSICCSPMGQVIARAGTESCILYVEPDFMSVERTRQQLPLIMGRRTDLYTITQNK